MLYKIFSKVLANRLKKLLPNIITKQQSAFIKDRLITDNILIAFESLHSMQNHTSAKDGYMAFKLDMSKAYDWVEWSFLEKIRVQWKMDHSHDALYIHYLLLYPHQQRTNEIYKANKGYSTRRPSITLPISSLHGSTPWLNILSSLKGWYSWLFPK